MRIAIAKGLAEARDNVNSMGLGSPAMTEIERLYRDIKVLMSRGQKYIKLSVCEIGFGELFWAVGSRPESHDL